MLGNVSSLPLNSNCPELLQVRTCHNSAAQTSRLFSMRSPLRLSRLISAAVSCTTQCKISQSRYLQVHRRTRSEGSVMVVDVSRIDHL
eukprot:COSAG02_NODE_31667_length_529_cov_1.072093_2_plen_87_part_01